ncbi:MAG: efflux RND transporter periplasmic adaptor subunit [Planctomycetes bacterium]|nr:efflux RND transporter periplasmic adaptor subunit [Planctomycetota bacterium]
MTTTMTPPPTADSALPQTPAPAPAALRPPGATRRGTWWAGAAGVVGVVLFGGWYLSTSLGRTVGTEGDQSFEVSRRSFAVTELSKGELKAAKTIDIKSKVEGRATILWLIEEGLEVAEGDLLVRLASEKIDERILQKESAEASGIAALEASEKEHEILVDQNVSDIRKAELKLLLAEIDLEKYRKGDSVKAFNDAQLEIDRAKQQHKSAQLAYEAAVKLKARGFITQRQLLEDEFRLEETKRAIEKATLSLRVLNDYTHPRDLKQKESDVTEARKELERSKKGAVAREAKSKADVEAKRANLLHVQNELRKHREQKEYTEIKAPSPGLVVYHSGHRYNPQRIAEGAEVYQGQTIVSLPDPSVMVVIVRIHEAKANRIKLEQKVTIELDGLPGMVFTGKVSKIAPLADSRNSWLNPDLKQYETEITLDEVDENLKPGMTARVEIMVDQVNDAVAVPLQSVFAKGGRHFVFMSEGREVKPVEVTVGKSSSEYVEIVEGLEQGDEVLLSVSQDARRLLPEPPPDEESVTGDEELGPPSIKRADGEAAGKQPEDSKRGRGSRRRSSS